MVRSESATEDRARIENLPVYRGDPGSPGERIVRLKKYILTTRRRLFVQPARIETESYRQTEGEPAIVRRACAFRDIALGIEIRIHPDELIAGNRSPLPRMGIVTPSAAVSWIDRELDTLPRRPQDPFDIDSQDIHELRDHIFPCWRGETLEDQVAASIPLDVKEAVDAGAFHLNQTDHAQGHILPDVETWLREGPRGLQSRVRNARERLEQNGELSRDKADFYRATEICLAAASDFIARYADLASELGRAAASGQRARELREVARNCRHLGTHPPETYWQALQSAAFLFVLLQIESNASSFSPGRLDQYMMPFLRHDLDMGILDLSQAQELLECLWIKFNEIVLLRSANSARYFAGFPIGFNVMTGGQLADGQDATNLMTFLCLQAQADVRLPQPNLSVRLHRNTPGDLLAAVSRVISLGTGMPQVFNDEVIVPGQKRRGVKHADAIDYAAVGCVELSIPGKALGWSDSAMFNLVRVLELTLHGGTVPETGRRIGLQTSRLEELRNYDDLEAAFEAQLRHYIGLMVKGANAVDRVHARACQTPFLSTVVADCIDKGLDVTEGGARYNFSGPQGVQIANLADSLAALRLLVFEKKEIAPHELMGALSRNFAGNDALRQRLLTAAPKYGNDDAYVDEIGRRWARFYCEEVGRYSTPRGGTFQPGFYTVSAHVPLGHDVGATPDGRLAYTPLADGGLSPVAGRDLKGPTAVLRSVSRIDQELASNGVLLNLKFLPSFFRHPDSIGWFKAFLRGFVDLRIGHVQFNVVSADTLRRAQQNPEQSRSLVVRVAGYSAYFVELSKEIQDEIIQRTGHGG
jgi:pyruvate formate-lyase/glycerol dehydratase family glycyl radical enzyme